MDVEVRDVAGDERAEWNRVLDTAFQRPVRDQAADDVYWARHPTPPERSSHQLGAFSDGCLVGTAHVFSTSVSLPGGADLAVEGLSGVGVLPTYRRRGALTALMATTLRDAADRAAAASVLIAAEYPIYGRFGYGPATESTAWEIRVPSRFRQPVSEGTTELVEPAELRKLGPDLFAELRTQRPGNIERDDLDWDSVTGLDPMPWRDRWQGSCMVRRDPAGRPTGYATYHVDAAPTAAGPTARCTSTTWWPRARRRQPRCGERAARWIGSERCGPPIARSTRWCPYLLVDGRQARQVARDDFMWLRVLDPVAVLGCRRSLTDRRVVIEVLDEAGFAGGSYELDGEGCRRSRRTADLTVPVEALGAVALGGPAVRGSAAAGWLREERPARSTTRTRSSTGRSPPGAQPGSERPVGARQLDAVVVVVAAVVEVVVGAVVGVVEAVVVGAALVVVADPPAVVVVVAPRSAPRPGPAPRRPTWPRRRSPVGGTPSAVWNCFSASVSSGVQMPSTGPVQ